MKQKILTLVLLATGLTMFGQSSPEQKIADYKNTRVVKIYTDDSMTNYEVKHDDTSLTRNYYDKNGNLVLESIYSFGDYYVNKRYVYNDKDQLVADSIEDNNRYYVYNEDGSLKYVNRFDNRNGNYLDSTYYEYADNKLINEITYNSKKAESGRYTYTYTDGLLTKRENLGSSGKVSARTEYKYDSNNNLIEEVEYAISTSSSTLGEIKSAERQQYSYDSANRLIEHLTTKATASSGVLNEYTNYLKIVNTYDSKTGLLAKSDKYIWDPDLLVFDYYDFNVYSHSSYSKDLMPQNFRISEGSAITKVKINIDKPSILDNFKGYKVIADDQVLDSLYTTESFEVEKQLRGVHYYRVMAMYDTIAGNVTDELVYNMDINLPAPSNGQVITKEYTTQWSVAFKWDAPQHDDNVNLIGYRYYMSGCNGALNGFYPGIVVDGADLTKGSLLIYPNTTKEYNIATIYLSAIYEEGESDIYSFEIDLRDTNDQIIAHWQNERCDITDADGYYLGSKHYYYSSSSSGNTESLICSIDYDDFNQPVYKNTSNSDSQTKQVWNPETMQWDNYEVTQWEKNIKTDIPNIDFIDQSTTKRIDSETGSYKNIFAVKQYKYYSPTYKVIHEISRHFEYDENGEEIYKYMVKHSSDDNLTTNTLYDTDEETILGKEELLYKRNKIISETNYDYQNGTFVKTSSKEYEYSSDTDLCVAIKEYEFDGDNKILVKNNDYVASKEYHYTKAPFNLRYKSGVLSWSKPSKEGINPTSFKVFVNYYEYANTTETSIQIEDVPTGSHVFTVMCMFDESESSMSTERKGNHVNYASFIPTAVDPAPYDAEIDNYVNTLSKVTLTFPSKVESMDETAEASFNSRFMTYPAPVTLAEDGLSVTFTLPENLENGMYFLSIPAKMFNSEESTYNPELSYTFLLQLPMTLDLPKPSVNPAEGELAQLESFELTFDQDVYALESLIGIAGSVYVEDAAKNRYDAVISAVENFDYTKWTITLNEKLTTEGKFTLVIPEATFGDSTASASSYSGAFTTGKVNPEYTFNYTIKDTAVDEIELNNSIKVEGNSIIVPQEAKVFNAAGIEVKPENLPFGVYVVVINNNVTKVVVK